jgi:hypothetical protein
MFPASPGHGPALAHWPLPAFSSMRPLSKTVFKINHFEASALQNPMYVLYSFSGNCVASFPISTFICLCCERFIYAQDRPHISLQQNRQTDPGNLSLIYVCRKWETEHYNSVLEITVSFLGIHKWKPDIYTGFSSAPFICSECVSQFYPPSKVLATN